MINFLFSILLGAIPDCLYYTLMFKKITQNKGKFLLLFGLILIFYIILNIVIPYNFYLYLLFDIIIYFILKLLYKKNIQIVDFFIIIYLELYLYITNCACYFLISNFAIAYIVNKILLFIPLFFSKKLNKLYIKYCSLWNRNYKKKNPIKSLTIRNISLLSLNILITIIYLILIYINK